MNERLDFWKAAYLIRLNNSKEPMAEDRANAANATANYAVDHLEAFLDVEEISE